MSATLSHQELAKDITERAMNSIQSEILNENLLVSEQAADVNHMIQIKKEAKQKKKEKHILTLDELNQIKHQKIQELRQIQNQTIEIKKQQNLAKSKVSKSSKKLWKSQLTVQDMIEIKELLKKQKKYQRQLKKKQQRLEEWINQKRLQDEQLKKQQVSEKSQQRKKELIKQRQELQKKKQQRAQLLQEEIHHLKQKKNSKLLYLQMLDSWKQYEEATQQQKGKLWELQKERRKIDATIIKEHESNYLQKKKEEQRKREKALEESHFHLPYIHSHCSLFNQLQQEEKDRLKEKEQKLRSIQENVFKRKEYGKNINELLFSNLKVKRDKDPQDDKEKSKSKTPAKAQDYHKLGNNYMKAVHQKITKQDIQKMKNSLKVPEKASIGISLKYKNYLQDMKHQKQNKGTLEAVESTLNNKTMDQIDKLHKVKMIFERDQREKKSDSEWFETLKGKMFVLDKLLN